MKQSTIKDKYEALRPLIVWLGLTELAWISYWLLRPDEMNTGYTTAVVLWIVVMLTWLPLAIYIGRRGFFLKHSRWMSNLVAVFMVVNVSVVMFEAIPGAKQGVIIAASAMTDSELASIHVLRLLAIGTIIKYLQRELPLHFLILGALPDFLFAVSAIVVTLMTGNESLSPGFLLAWHSIGCLAFLGAGISMFFSVPSPLRIYQSGIDSSIAFKYPMFLAPNFTVPLFILAHVFALVKLGTGG